MFKVFYSKEYRMPQLGDDSDFPDHLRNRWARTEDKPAGMRNGASDWIYGLPARLADTSHQRSRMKGEDAVVKAVLERGFALVMPW